LCLCVAFNIGFCDFSDIFFRSSFYFTDLTQKWFKWRKTLFYL
jgi:hypothetical protein